MSSKSSAFVKTASIIINQYTVIPNLLLAKNLNHFPMNHQLSQPQTDELVSEICSRISENGLSEEQLVTLSESIGKSQAANVAKNGNIQIHKYWLGWPKEVSC